MPSARGAVHPVKPRQTAPARSAWPFCWLSSTPAWYFWRWTPSPAPAVAAGVRCMAGSVFLLPRTTRLVPCLPSPSPCPSLSTVWTNNGVSLSSHWVVRMIYVLRTDASDNVDVRIATSHLRPTGVQCSSPLRARVSFSETTLNHTARRQSRFGPFQDAAPRYFRSLDFLYGMRSVSVRACLEER